MKNWIRRTLLGVAGASIVLGGLTACGHAREHRGWGASAEAQARQRDKVVERVTQRLELNEAQKEKLRALAATLQAQRAALQAQGDPRAQLRSLVAGEKFDRAQALALARTTAGAIEARSPAVVAALADFYDSLDPRQQAIVRERMEGRRGWWHRG
ncbi:MAG: Spy/CpxP family protein refolding chaperone [Ramlibacter sp.]